jgi:hypothetical protein
LRHEPVDPATLDVARRIANAVRARHYRALFLDEDGEVSIHGRKVLADLNRFCRGNASTFHADPRTHALLEGRREVLLRLLTLLKIDSATIAKYVEVIDE